MPDDEEDELSFEDAMSHANVPAWDAKGQFDVLSSSSSRTCVTP
jgi:hypothetical protein